MNEDIKVRWLKDNEGTKVAPKTLSSQIYNEDGTLFKNEINQSFENFNNSIEELNNKIENIPSQVQVNWDQNDENALDYVKNRPFYDTGEYEWIEILNNPTIGGMPGVLNMINPFPALLVDKQYKIIFNEQEFICTAKKRDGGADIYLGAFINFSTGEFIDGQDDDIPFSIVSSGDMGLLQVREELPTTFIIYKQQNIIQQLDRKYINYIPGEKTAGSTVSYEGIEYICEEGAEIFNNKLNIAIGGYSHSEGDQTYAVGACSHAEGHATQAKGQSSHAEGGSTEAVGTCSHAEGLGAEAKGDYSHSEGMHTIASARTQHVQGKYNIEDIDDKYAHIVGNGTVNTGGTRSNAHTLDWEGNAWFQGDIYTGSTSGINMDEGSKKLATEEYVNEQVENISIPEYITAGQKKGETLGSKATAEGLNNIASGNFSHVEGMGNIASNNSSHAEGNETIASGMYSHAEGRGTVAPTMTSHAQGLFNIIDKEEGPDVYFGMMSYRPISEVFEKGTVVHKLIGEQDVSILTGKIISELEEIFIENLQPEDYFVFTEEELSNKHYYLDSITLVDEDETKVNCSYYTFSTIPFQKLGNYAHIVGNGGSEGSRSNAHTIDWHGNGWFAGDVYTGSTSGTDRDEGSKKLATEEYVENLYKKLSSNMKLGFYCIEDVTIIINGVSRVYPANSNAEIILVEDDTFEIVPTSNSSILSLTAYPGALGTFYPWLEGVAQFSNILFDMNDEAMYSKWSQGNQGAYNVQTAQYLNCIFWSDNPYISDVARRTNYTLTHTSQLPLCYSTIPDNTFKAFYLAFNVNSDPNWGNQAYKDSFAKATWATQVFSYYGARIVGIPGHDSSTLTITLPKDCRGLMFDARNIEGAGVFDAINTTNFGAKSGSWREAFGFCISLRRLYIKNLKVSLNISWSPIDYDSIYYIISSAANTNAITISVSPYTYNLLNPSDFELAASKNITIALLTANYAEDKRLSEIANKADKIYVDNQIANLINSAPDTLDTLGELATAFNENKEIIDALNESIVNKQNKNVIVYRDSTTKKASMTAPEIMEKVHAGENVYYTTSLSGGTLHPYLEGADTGVFFYSNYIDNDRVIGTGILIGADGTITSETYQLDHLSDSVIHITSAERNRWNDTYTKTETDGLLEAKANVENPVLSGTLGLNHTGELGFTSVSLGFANEASGMYCFSEGMGNKSTGSASHTEGTGNTASADAAHAEGYGTEASNVGAHAEGANTKATGYGSHAEGSNTIASIEGQHVEGKYNIDDTTAIHIVGNGTSNSNRSNAHTLNLNGEAWYAGDVYVGSTSGSHKDEGSKKLATEEYVDNKTIDPILIENKKEKDIIVTYSENSTFKVTHSTEEIYEAVQNGTTIYFKKGTELLNLMEITQDYATFFMFYMNMEGKPQQKVIVINGDSIMLDQDDTYNYATVAQLNDKADKTSLNSYYNKIEVDNLLSSVGSSDNALLKTEQSLTEEDLTQVRKNLRLIGRDVEGQQFTIDGTTVTANANAEIFGDYTSNIAVGQWSIAEGSGTIAKGRASHAEGAMTQALNDGCHVEGYQTKATGYWSHAEGEMTVVSSYASHAEGSYCTLPDGTKRYGTASGYASHVEGGGCHTTASCSHAEGLATTASGAQAHVEGRYTIAAGGAQHVEGIANIEDAEGKYIHIAGNGTFDNRKNAYTLDWNGNGWFAGNLYVGGASQEDGSKIATETFVSNSLSGIQSQIDAINASLAVAVEELSKI